MGLSNNLDKEYQHLCSQRIDLELQIYHKMFPTEIFQTPEIIISYDFHADSIKAYQNFDYPDDYISGLEKRAHWNSTVALTINNKKMNLPAKIIIDALNWRDDTLLHELTHVNDYYNYCQKHSYSELVYLDFLEVEEFLSVYLFSEFRAFYRCAKFSKEELKKRLEYETEKFERYQIETIDSQQLEAYYYHLVSYVGFYCAYLDKYSTEEKINAILEQPDANIVHTLIKFLYPLRDKSFDVLENYFNNFQALLDSFVEK